MTLLALTPLALTPLAITPLARADGGSLIAGHRPSAEAVISKAALDLKAGRLDPALSALQKLLDEFDESPRLLLEEAQPGSFRRFGTVHTGVRRFLNQVPAAVQERYRALFEPAAGAALSAAASSHSIPQLRRCFERYPITIAGKRAGLWAADGLLESGHVYAARTLYEALATPTDDDAVDSVDSVSDLARQRLAAVPELWGREPEGTVVRPNKAFFQPGELLQGGFALAWHRKTQAPQVAQSYVSRATWNTDTLVLPFHGGCQGFNLDTGAPGVRIQYPAFHREFVETSQNLELGVTRVGNLMVSSYVRSATLKEGFGRRGRVRKVPIPRRSLHAVDLTTGQVRWDTGSSNSDGLLPTLSFNSPATVRAGQVLALGWTWSGFVSVWLVCLDLESGTLIWKCPIVNGQVELTRFGEMAHEPMLGEVTVEQGLVFVNTHLGAVAAVAAMDGRLAWLTQYYPVRQPQSLYYRRRMSYPYQPEIFWQHTPPILCGDRLHIVAQDCPDLLVLDRSDGRVLGRQTLSGEDLSLLTVRESGLVVGSHSAVARLDPETLEAVWRQALPEPAIGRIRAIDDGLLYWSQVGLCYLSFGLEPRHASTRQILFAADTGSSMFESHAASLRISVLPDRILVTTPFEIACFVRKQ